MPSAIESRKTRLAFRHPTVESASENDGAASEIIYSRPGLSNQYHNGASEAPKKRALDETDLEIMARVSWKKQRPPYNSEPTASSCKSKSPGQIITNRANFVDVSDAKAANEHVCAKGQFLRVASEVAAKALNRGFGLIKTNPEGPPLAQFGDGEPASNVEEKMVDDESQFLFNSAPSKGIRRAWPLSQLRTIIHNDDDEHERGSDDQVDAEDAVRPEILPAYEVYNPAKLTTMIPQVNDNIFHLLQTAAESFPNRGTFEGTLVKLKPGEVLSIVGSYLLTVIQGVISLTGVRLETSRRPHRVFAPRCSPIPTIYALPLTDRSASDCLDNAWMQIPATIQKLITPQDSVILLQTLASGIEGLGSVCEPFADVWPHPDEQENDALSLKNARIVCI